MLFRLVTVLAFAVLTVQLWGLQVTNGATYRADADRNGVRVVQVEPLRGNHPLPRAPPTGPERAELQPGVGAGYVPSDQFTAIFGRMAHMVRQPVATLLATYNSNKRMVGDYDPVEVATNVPYTTTVAMIERHQEFPGVTIIQVPYRVYTYGNLFGQTSATKAR